MLGGTCWPAAEQSAQPSLRHTPDLGTQGTERPPERLRLEEVAIRPHAM